MSVGKSALISKPAWIPEVRKAETPPSIEELFPRMKRELQKAEEEEVAWYNFDKSRDPNAFDFDPKRLLPPEIVEALEFEIAPGEPALFITMRRLYDFGDPSHYKSGDTWNSSNWHTIILKDGLKQLWSAGWAFDDFKQSIDYNFMGAADVNGDGITEVLINNREYQGETYSLFEYKNRKLIKELSTCYCSNL
jgi:hypothetical protein